MKQDSLEALIRERAEVIERIGDLKATLELMPKNTVLGRIFIERGYLPAAERKLRKIDEEIARLESNA